MPGVGSIAMISVTTTIYTHFLKKNWVRPTPPPLIVTFSTFNIGNKLLNQKDVEFDFNIGNFSAFLNNKLKNVCWTI